MSAWTLVKGSVSLVGSLCFVTGAALAVGGLYKQQVPEQPDPVARANEVGWFAARQTQEVIHDLTLDATRLNKIVRVAGVPIAGASYVVAGTSILAKEAVVRTYHYLVDENPSEANPLDLGNSVYVPSGPKRPDRREPRSALRTHDNN